MKTICPLTAYSPSNVIFHPSYLLTVCYCWLLCIPFTSFAIQFVFRSLLNTLSSVVTQFGMRLISAPCIKLNGREYTWYFLPQGHILRVYVYHIFCRYMYVQPLKIKIMGIHVVLIRLSLMLPMEFGKKKHFYSFKVFVLNAMIEKKNNNIKH